MKETAFTPTQMLISQRVFARAQTLINQPGWRQVMSLQEGAQTLALTAGSTLNLFLELKHIHSAQSTHCELWMLLAIPLNEDDFQQLQQWGVKQIFALSSWYDEEVLEATQKHAKQLGIEYEVLEDKQCEQLNFGRLNLMKRYRPWYMSSQSLSASGHAKPMLSTDKTGFFQHFLKRFDTCVLPWEHRQEVSHSPLNIMFEQRKTTSLKLVDQQGNAMLQVPATRDVSEQAEVVNHFYVSQAFGEVCLDGPLALTDILSKQNMIDENKQAVIGHSQHTQYDVMGQSVLQTTTFTR